MNTHDVTLGNDQGMTVTVRIKALNEAIVRAFANDMVDPEKWAVIRITKIEDA